MPKKVEKKPIPKKKDEQEKPPRGYEYKTFLVKKAKKSAEK